jgi:hypothetical protein
MRLFLLRGRSDRRVAVSMPVYLARASLPAEAELAVAIDAVEHGLRVITRRYWRPGEVLIVSPLSNQPGIAAKVAYCSRQLEHTYNTGLEVKSASPRWWDKFSVDRPTTAHGPSDTSDPRALK